MNRPRIASAAATAAALAGAWALWRASPDLIAMAGLRRYDLLARVVIVFAALGLAEAIAGRVAARVFPSPEGEPKDSDHGH